MQYIIVLLFLQKKAREAVDVRVRRGVVAVEVHRGTVTPVVPVAADKDRTHSYLIPILKTNLQEYHWGLPPPIPR